MRLLKSVEEFLYELVTWILFYPLTLWRCIRHPLKMMAYAETELGNDETKQYDDGLSPPILLLITLFVSHLISLRFGVDHRAELPEVFVDERNHLAFRAIAFSVFPLLLALQSVRQRGAKLTRQMLKPPFYSQCYTAAPFVLSVDIALIIGQHGSPPAIGAAIAIFAAGLIWYLASQTTWFAKRGNISHWHALLTVTATVLAGFIIMFAGTLITALAVTTPT